MRISPPRGQGDRYADSVKDWKKVVFPRYCVVHDEEGFRIRIWPVTGGSIVRERSHRKRRFERLMRDEGRTDRRPSERSEESRPR